MATDHFLYIHQHMDRSSRRLESKRFRIRAQAAFEDSSASGSEVNRLLRAEAGIAVPGQQGVVLYWAAFFEKHPIEEVLTTITVIYDLLSRRRLKSEADQFREAIARALAEEHLGYRIDERGAVRLAVDEQFEVTRQTTVAALNDPRLAVARACFESAYQHFDRRPQDTKAAVRSMFEAIEVLAKQLIPAARNLNDYLCRNQLRERHRAASTGDAVEQRVWDGMFESMGKWVDAMHQYRHGQTDSEAPPSEEFAIYALSSGSAYLRMLAQFALRVGVQPAPAEPAAPTSSASTPDGPNDTV